MIVIRQIQSGEWEVGRALRLMALCDSPSAFSETYADAAAVPDEFWQGRAERGAKGDTSFWVMAYADDEPVGMAVGIADQGDSTMAYLAAMWVAPEYRGTDVAPSLVDSVANWATTRGATVLFAGVLCCNSRAASFYRKAGFAEHAGAIPEHPATNGSEIVMSRRLESHGH